MLMMTLSDPVNTAKAQTALKILHSIENRISLPIMVDQYLFKLFRAFKSRDDYDSKIRIYLNALEKTNVIDDFELNK
jgi:hypothetical protein